MNHITGNTNVGHTYPVAGIPRNVGYVFYLCTLPVKGYIPRNVGHTLLQV